VATLQTAVLRAWLRPDEAMLTGVGMTDCPAVGRDANATFTLRTTTCSCVEFQPDGKTIGQIWDGRPTLGQHGKHSARRGTSSRFGRGLFSNAGPIDGSFDGLPILELRSR